MSTSYHGDLFDLEPVPTRNRHRPAYQPSSTTRKAAADRIAPYVATQREQYYNWLASCGDFGATDEEASISRRMRVASVCARRNELVRLGRVVKTDRIRNRGHVWKAVLPC